MAQEVPPVVRGTVEVDATSLGGAWKNKRARHRRAGTKRGRGPAKTPVFGILCRGGQGWAQVVPDGEAQTLLPLIRRRVKRGSVVCSDTWRSYTGIAAKGYVHRLVDHGQRQVNRAGGIHINGLEGFWGYLKRRLAVKDAFGVSGCRYTSQSMYGVTTIGECPVNNRSTSLPGS